MLVVTFVMVYYKARTLEQRGINMDHAAKGLLFKEWKMMKGFFIGQFVIIAIFLAATKSFLGLENLIETMAVGFVMIPLTVLYSLNSEANQMEAFLHNPQSIFKLLLAKFIYAFLNGAVVLLVLSLLSAGYEVLWHTSQMSAFQVFGYLSLESGQMLIISLCPAMVLVFFWTLYHYFKKYISGSISLVFNMILLVVTISLINVFLASDMYAWLTHWGRVFYPCHSIINGFGSNSVMFIGSYVFYTMVTVILFLFSAYLIDRKVEV